MRIRNAAGSSSQRKPLDVPQSFDQMLTAFPQLLHESNAFSDPSTEYIVTTLLSAAIDTTDDNPDAPQAAARLLAQHLPAPSPNITKLVLDFMVLCPQHVIPYIPDLVSADEEEINVVFDVLIDLLSSERKLLVPIIATLSEMPLNSTHTDELKKILMMALDTVEASDLPTVVRAILRSSQSTSIVELKKQWKWAIFVLYDKISVQLDVHEFALVASIISDSVKMNNTAIRIWVQSIKQKTFAFRSSSSEQNSDVSSVQFSPLYIVVWITLLSYSRHSRIAFDSIQYQAKFKKLNSDHFKLIMHKYSQVFASFSYGTRRFLWYLVSANLVTKSVAISIYTSVFITLSDAHRDIIADLLANFSSTVGATSTSTKAQIQILSAQVLLGLSEDQGCVKNVAIYSHILRETLYTMDASVTKEAIRILAMAFANLLPFSSDIVPSFMIFVRKSLLFGDAFQRSIAIDIAQQLLPKMNESRFNESVRLVHQMAVTDIIESTANEILSLFMKLMFRKDTRQYWKDKLFLQDVLQNRILSVIPSDTISIQQSTFKCTDPSISTLAVDTTKLYETKIQKAWGPLVVTAASIYEKLGNLSEFPHCLLDIKILASRDAEKIFDLFRENGYNAEGMANITQNALLSEQHHVQEAAFSLLVGATIVYHIINTVTEYYSGSIANDFHVRSSILKRYVDFDTMELAATTLLSANNQSETSNTELFGEIQHPSFEALRFVMNTMVPPNTSQNSDSLFHQIAFEARLASRALDNFPVDSKHSSELDDLLSYLLTRLDLYTTCADIVKNGGIFDKHKVKMLCIQHISKILVSYGLLASTVVSKWEVSKARNLFALIEANIISRHGSIEEFFKEKTSLAQDPSVVFMFLRLFHTIMSFNNNFFKINPSILPTICLESLKTRYLIEDETQFDSMLSTKECLVQNFSIGSPLDCFRLECLLSTLPNDTSLNEACGWVFAFSSHIKSRNSSMHLHGYPVVSNDKLGNFIEVLYRTAMFKCMNFSVNENALEISCDILSKIFNLLGGLVNLHTKLREKMFQVDKERQDLSLIVSIAQTLPYLKSIMLDLVGRHDNIPKSDRVKFSYENCLNHCKAFVSRMKGSMKIIRIRKDARTSIQLGLTLTRVSKHMERIHQIVGAAMKGKKASVHVIFCDDDSRYNIGIGVRQCAMQCSENQEKSNSLFPLLQSIGFSRANGGYALKENLQPVDGRFFVEPKTPEKIAFHARKRKQAHAENDSDKDFAKNCDDDKDGLDDVRTSVIRFKNV